MWLLNVIQHTILGYNYSRKPIFQYSLTLGRFYINRYDYEQGLFKLWFAILFSNIRVHNDNRSQHRKFLKTMYILFPEEEFFLQYFASLYRTLKIIWISIAFGNNLKFEISIALIIRILKIYKPFQHNSPKKTISEVSVFGEFGKIFSLSLMELPRKNFFFFFFELLELLWQTSTIISIITSSDEKKSRISVEMMLLFR